MNTRTAALMEPTDNQHTAFKHLSVQHRERERETSHDNIETVLETNKQTNQEHIGTALPLRSSSLCDSRARSISLLFCASFGVLRSPCPSIAHDLRSLSCKSTPTFCYPRSYTCAHIRSLIFFFFLAVWGAKTRCVKARWSFHWRFTAASAR